MRYLNFEYMNTQTRTVYSQMSAKINDGTEDTERSSSQYRAEEQRLSVSRNGTKSP